MHTPRRPYHWHHAAPHGPALLVSQPLGVAFAVLPVRTLPQSNRQPLNLNVTLALSTADVLFLNRSSLALSSWSPVWCLRRAGEEGGVGVDVGEGQGLAGAAAELGGALCSSHPWCAVASPGLSGTWLFSAYCRPLRSTMPSTVYQ
eukprot:CAMPEP_0202851856 /NCGR_PEP_ID=MMETSP1389-20130828/87478_1 /ASSEMBLY_ACC=CAM_ASM_000865 /TAXON_ID=302021 /ORGANISM="Rhodomonas sp., Strain CCMP768" /LENGTH=145 /DNA_ID=CAMNT_0049530235 /DNA_START=80 /DNA_END=518 /DNA_ORIENTATION=+